jgi:hypothetical protein
MPDFYLLLMTEAGLLPTFLSKGRASMEKLRVHYLKHW